MTEPKIKEKNPKPLNVTGTFYIDFTTPNKVEQSEMRNDLSQVLSKALEKYLSDNDIEYWDVHPGLLEKHLCFVDEVETD